MMKKRVYCEDFSVPHLAGRKVNAAVYLLEHAVFRHEDTPTHERERVTAFLHFCQSRLETILKSKSSQERINIVSSHDSLM